MKDAEHFRIFLTILSIKFKERQKNHTVLFSDANVTGKTIKKKKLGSRYHESQQSDCVCVCLDGTCGKVGKCF